MAWRPASQFKPVLRSGQLHVTLMSSKHEPKIWSGDTGQWIPCFERCQIVHNMEAQLQNFNDYYRLL